MVGFPHDGKTTDELRGNADLALYRAKADGRGTYCVFDSRMDAVLKDQRVLFMKFDDRGRLKRVRTPDALREHGRIRQVVDGPGHDLLVLTDNGDGQDEILRVSPR